MPGIDPRRWTEGGRRALRTLRYLGAAISPVASGVES
jgi:hypothetical protein